MVDVSGKEVTARSAGASGRVLLSAEAVAALRAGEAPKGDALAVVRIAVGALGLQSVCGDHRAGQVERAQNRPGPAVAD